MGQTSSSSSSSRQRPERVIVLMALCHGERNNDQLQYNKDKLINVLATLENCGNFSDDIEKAFSKKYCT